MHRAIGQPVVVAAETSSRLEPIRLGTGTGFDETWLQKVLIDHPSALPVLEIEPGFASLASVAREVPCKHGTIDNLYITGNGEIVVVEAKLWMNAEARRKVVAQTLDYVAALSRMNFEQFQQTALRGQVARSDARTLHAFVADQPDALPERDFIDAVSNNLRRGRMLALVVGDGIRSETEALGELLQSHAGAHFTFGLVEMTAYRMPDQTILLVPRTLVRTVMIERAVVRIEGTGISVDAIGSATTASTIRETLTDKAFYETMEARKPGMGEAVRNFAQSLEPLGVFIDLKETLNLKWDPGTGRPVNLGYISRNGKLWTNPLALNTSRDIASRYAERLAAAIGGMVGAGTAGNDPYVTTNGKSAPRIEQLLPHHSAEWRLAIEQLQDDVRTGLHSGDLPD
jgi:hypothetical protein